MTTETSNAREWVLVPRVPTPEMVQASNDISCRAEGEEHWAAMLAAAPPPAAPPPPSAPAGDCPDCTNSQQCDSCSRDEQAVLESSAAVGVETNWPDDYCPECGSNEVSHREDNHIQCGACGQEYFTDIDYSDVVRENLKRLFAIAQQPPVATMGVEGIAGRLRNLAAIMRGDGGTERIDGKAWERVEELAASLGALSQQPAAVDEAMTRRIMSEFHANDPGDVWPPDEQGRLRRKALQDAINNALAAQHQGPTT